MADTTPSRGNEITSKTRLVLTIPQLVCVLGVFAGAVGWVTHMEMVISGIQHDVAQIEDRVERVMQRVDPDYFTSRPVLRQFNTIPKGNTP